MWLLLRDQVRLVWLVLVSITVGILYLVKQGENDGYYYKGTTILLRGVADAVGLVGFLTLL